MREHNPTPARKLASRVGLSGLPRCYRPRDAACHRLRVVVCAQRSPRPSSTTHGCNLADRRRRPRRCQPRRLSAGWTARTSWRPHPALRVGTLSARRKTGRADARCHRRGRACPLGGTGSPRRSLGGEEDVTSWLLDGVAVALRPRHLLRSFAGGPLTSKMKMAHGWQSFKRTIRALLLSVIDQSEHHAGDVRHLPRRLQDGHKRDGVPVLHRYLRKLAAHDCLSDGWID